MRSYIENGYLEINALRRHLIGTGLSKSLAQSIMRDARAIDAMFNRLPGLPSEILLYRGTNGAGQAVPAVGSIISDPALISTSADLSIANVYVFGVPGMEYPGAKKARQISKDQIRTVAEVRYCLCLPLA